MSKYNFYSKSHFHRLLNQNLFSLDSSSEDESVGEHGGVSVMETLNLFMLNFAINFYKNQLCVLFKYLLIVFLFLSKIDLNIHNIETQKILFLF